MNLEISSPLGGCDVPPTPFGALAYNFNNDIKTLLINE